MRKATNRGYYAATQRLSAETNILEHSYVAISSKCHDDFFAKFWGRISVIREPETTKL